MGQATSSKTCLRLSPCTKIDNAVINMTSINAGSSMFSKHEILWEELIYKQKQRGGLFDI